MPFITDPRLRDALAKAGHNPDDPALIAALDARGFGAMFGPQPNPSITGTIGAALTGVGRGVLNAGINAAQLPLALVSDVARGITQGPLPAESQGFRARPDPRAPSPIPEAVVPNIAPGQLEQAHPIASGVGGVASFVLPFMALARAGKMVGLIEKGASSLDNAILAAERGVAVSTEGAQLLGSLARPGVSQTQAVGDFLATKVAPKGLFGGLTPKAIALRAGRDALSFGAVNFITSPGSIDERVQAAYEGVKMGAFTGGLGPAMGSSKAIAMARLAAGGAIAPPFDVPGVPGPIVGAIMAAPFVLMHQVQRDPGAAVKPGEAVSRDARTTAAKATLDTQAASNRNLSIIENFAEAWQLDPSPDKSAFRAALDANYPPAQVAEVVDYMRSTFGPEPAAAGPVPPAMPITSRSEVAELHTPEIASLDVSMEAVARAGGREPTGLAATIASRPGTRPTVLKSSKGGSGAAPSVVARRTGALADGETKLSDGRRALVVQDSDAYTIYRSVEGTPADSLWTLEKLADPGQPSWRTSRPEDRAYTEQHQVRSQLYSYITRLDPTLRKGGLTDVNDQAAVIAETLVNSDSDIASHFAKVAAAPNSSIGFQPDIYRARILGMRSMLLGEPLDFVPPGSTAAAPEMTPQQAARAKALVEDNLSRVLDPDQYPEPIEHEVAAPVSRAAPSDPRLTALGTTDAAWSDAFDFVDAHPDAPFEAALTTMRFLGHKNADAYNALSYAQGNLSARQRRRITTAGLTLLPDDGAPVPKFGERPADAVVERSSVKLPGSPPSGASPSASAPPASPPAATSLTAVPLQAYQAARRQAQALAKKYVGGARLPSDLRELLPAREPADTSAATAELSGWMQAIIDRYNEAQGGSPRDRRFLKAIPPEQGVPALRMEASRLEADRMQIAKKRATAEALITQRVAAQNTRALARAEDLARRAAERSTSLHKTLEEQLSAVKEATKGLADLHAKATDEAAPVSKRRDAGRQLEKRSAAVEKLALKARETQAALNAIDPPVVAPDSIRFAAAVAEIRKAQDLAAISLDALQDPPSPSSAQPLVELSIRRQAVALFGQPMSDVPGLFEALPAAMREEHTLIRLLDARTQGPAQTVYRARLLRQFSRLTDAQAHPLVATAATAKSPDLILPMVNAQLDAMAGGRSPISLSRHDSGRGAHIWRVTDRTTGTVVDAPNAEAAVMVAERRLRARADAPLLTPPMTPTIRLAGLAPGEGPRTPPTLPGGMDGEPGGLTPPIILHATEPPLPGERSPGEPAPLAGAAAKKPVSLSWFDRVVNDPIVRGAKFDTLIKAAADLGEDLGWAPRLQSLARRYQTFRLRTGEVRGQLITLLDRHKIGYSRATLGRLKEYAQAIDRESYTIQSSSGPEQARAALPEIMQRVASDMGVPDSWPALHADVLNEVLTPLYGKFGIPADYVVGYWTRANFSRSPAFKEAAFRDLPPDAARFLQFDPALVRTSAEGNPALAAADATHVDAIRRAVADEFYHKVLQGDYYTTIMGYASAGFRMTELAETGADAQSFIMGLSDQHGVMLSQPTGARMMEDIRRFLGLASQADIDRKTNLAGHYVNLAEKVQDIYIDHMKNVLPDAMVAPARKLVESLRVRAAEGEVYGMMEIWTNAYRNGLFGFHPMRFLRDGISTQAFFLAPRFAHTGMWSRAMGDIYFNPKERTATAERAHALDCLPNDVHMAAQEEAGIIGHVSKYSRKFNELANSGYSKNDVLLRLSGFRLAELGVERGLRDYHKAGSSDKAFDEFVVANALDTYNLAFTDSIRGELRALADAGDTSSLIRKVTQFHHEMAIFEFGRAMGPGFYDSAAGRAFGQFGSWPVKAVNSLWQMYRAPIAYHASRGNARRGWVRAAGIATRYALAAEAVYAVGGLLGVDTSSWIPFIHNLGYDGGPLWSLMKTASGFVSGDPDVTRRFTSDWKKGSWQLLARNAPFTGSDILKRVVSQTVEQSPADAKWWGLYPQQESYYDRGAVMMGFEPLGGYSSKPPELFRPLARVGGTIFNPAQDALSKLSGDVVAPGSYDALSDYRRPLGR